MFLKNYVICMNKLKISLGGLTAFGVITLLITLSSASTIVASEDAVAAYDDSSKPLLDSSVRDESQDFVNEALPLTEIFKQSESGIVSISVKKSTTFESSGVGSGFVYDHTGNIITNNHVVEDAEKITVTFIDGKSYDAKIIGTDAYSDLAVIKIPPNTSLNPLTIGNSDLLKVGEGVTAIGNPYGLSGSMTSGIVSQIGRTIPSQNSAFSIPGVIQTDAAINPGNSGGPLFNLYGDVIGVTTAIYSKNGDFSGVGFAIPANTLTKIVPILIQQGVYNHPWIGITSVNMTPDLAEILGLDESKGVMIMDVIKDGPADKSGLRGSSEIIEKDGIDYKIGGDVILTIDDRDVRKIDDILIHLQKEKIVGDKTSFKILRDNKIISVDVVLNKRPN